MLNSAEHEIVSAIKSILSLLNSMKMPTIVGIFVLISREIFMLSYVWLERICSYRVSVIQDFLAGQISCSTEGGMHTLMKLDGTGICGS